MRLKQRIGLILGIAIILASVALAVFTALQIVGVIEAQDQPAPMLTQVSYTEGGIQHFVYLVPPDGPQVFIADIDPEFPLITFSYQSGATSTLGWNTPEGVSQKLDFVPDGGAFQVQDVPSPFE